MPVSKIPITMIEPPNPVLRRFRENSPEFLELVDQIKDHGGCLQAPPARPLSNGKFQLADGYRRYRCHIVAGVGEMILNVFKMTDEEYLIIQMQCNAGHLDTDFIDFARHLDRLRYMTDKEMTMSELAAKCKKSKTWVRKILKLNNLHPAYAEMARRNEMPISNAKWLGHLPRTEQSLYIKQACVLNTIEFETVVKTVLNNYRESIRQGKLDRLGIDTFKPTMRDFNVIKAEIKTPSRLPSMIAAANITNPLEAAMLAIQWVFKIDPDAITERKEKMLNRELQKINDAHRRSLDRESLRFNEESQITY